MAERGSVLKKNAVESIPQIHDACAPCPSPVAATNSAALYDNVIADPVLKKYLRAFSNATNVHVEIARTKATSRRAIVVPLLVTKQAVAYLVAHPPTHGFTVRRQGIHDLLQILAGVFKGSADRYLTTPNTCAIPCVIRADKYIHAHYHESLLSLVNVAREIGLCGDHFGRVFRQATGLAFTDYVARVRVEKVKELLTTTSRRVSEVAYACGFESIPHFNRVFKRHTGQTPKAYRAA